MKRTYKTKTIEYLIENMGVNRRDATSLVYLIASEYKPCVFNFLNAPKDLDDWNTEIPEMKPRFAGRIEWIHTDGRVREFQEYENIENLKKVAVEELKYGVPISVVCYIDAVEKEKFNKLAGEIVNESGATPCSFNAECYKDRKTYHKAYLDDKNVSFEQFYSLLYESGLGYWDNVNCKETVLSYVIEKIKEDVCVSHILSAVEENPFCKYFNISLCYSAETPKPIETKYQLIEALGLTFEDLDAMYIEE